MSKEQPDFKGLLRQLVLSEITRYREETGENFNRWSAQLARHMNRGLYVTFSPRSVLSVSPLETRRDLVGIYSYPLETGKIPAIPAIALPYVIVFKPKPGLRVMDMPTYTQQQMDSDMGMLMAAHPELASTLKGGLAATEESPARTMWNILINLAGSISTAKNSALPSKKKEWFNIDIAKSGELTKLLRDVLGYQGIVGDNSNILGTATLFFETRFLDIVEVVSKEDGVGWTGPDTVRTNTTSEALAAFAKQVKKGRVVNGIWPGNVLMRNMNLTGVRFLDTKITAKFIQNVKVTNCVFQNSTLNANNGMMKCTLEEVAFNVTDKDSGGVVIPKFIQQSTFDGVQVVGTFPSSEFYRSQIESLTIRNGSPRSDRYGSVHSLRFNVCNISNLVLQGIKSAMIKLSVEGSNLSGASIRSSKLGSIEVVGSTVDSLDFIAATVLGVRIIDSTLKNVDFTKLNLTGDFMIEGKCKFDKSVRFTSAQVSKFVDGYGQPLKDKSILSQITVIERKQAVTDESDE